LEANEFVEAIVKNKELPLKLETGMSHTKLVGKNNIILLRNHIYHQLPLGPGDLSAHIMSNSGVVRSRISIARAPRHMDMMCALRSPGPRGS
jgi:hypothetical protein